LDNVANIVTEVECNSSTNMLYLIYESIGQIKQYVCLSTWRSCTNLRSNRTRHKRNGYFWNNLQPETRALVWCCRLRSWHASTGTTL